jgi:hypothetical protein
MLFVCLIVSDLAWDASCDDRSVSATSGVAVSVTPADHNRDACAPLCVADCYCCSRSVSPSLIVVLPEAGPLAPVPAFSPTPSPDGVRPVPYHPPLLLV